MTTAVGAIFQPTPLDWLFGSGIGTNIGASIIWGFLAGLLGVYVARRARRAWARMRSRIDSLHARHDEHSLHLGRIEARLEELHRSMDNT